MHPGYYDYYRRPGYVSVNVAPNPVYYNYGDNIQYKGDMVYVNGVPYVSAEKYYEQSMELASRGKETTVIQIVQQPSGTQSTDNQVVVLTPEEALAATENNETLPFPTLAAKPDSVEGQDPQSASPSEQWLPLGTFALLDDEEEGTSHQVLQIAMNRGGVLRGNLFDEKEDKLLPIIGAVDQETQRVAFRIADDSDARVYECGLWNLTQESLPVLVQEGKDKAETRKAVRLQDPESGESSSSPGTTDNSFEFPSQEGWNLDSQVPTP